MENLDLIQSSANSAELRTSYFNPEMSSQQNYLPEMDYNMRMEIDKFNSIIHETSGIKCKEPVNTADANKIMSPID